MLSERSAPCCMQALLPFSACRPLLRWWILSRWSCKTPDQLLFNKWQHWSVAFRRYISEQLTVAESGVARNRCEEGVRNYIWRVFVAHKLTRNNVLNKVDVAATELPQSATAVAVYEATAQSRCQTLCSSKVSWKYIIEKSRPQRYV